MATSVSQLLGGVLDYLGRPTSDKINLGLILPLLLDSLDYFGLDLQLSTENALLKFYQYFPSNKDELVVAPGFSVPVAMQIRNSSSTWEADWRDIEIANASDVQTLGRDGVKAVAFYGTPARMIWSFDPISDWAIEAKLWYEPIPTQPSALSDSSKLSEAFNAMVKLKTAIACAPYCGFAMDQAASLIAVLQNQLNAWEKKWILWVNIDRNATVVIKRDFRGRRTKHRGNRWQGWGW